MKLTTKKKNGLYQKYNVSRTDGRIDPDAKFIVLRIDGSKRTAERWAVLKYADMLDRENPDNEPVMAALADDLRKHVVDNDPKINP